MSNGFADNSPVFRCYNMRFTTKSTPLGSLIYPILLGFKILIDQFCSCVPAYCHSLATDKVG
jgi:hypothetical protein